jgi:hypothetical protein
MSQFVWEQGEHITLVGPTSSGKTSLARVLLRHRKYVLALATKPRDPVTQLFRKDGFIIRRDWPPPPPDIAPKVVYWPRIEKMTDIQGQQMKMRQVFHDVYVTGGYTLYLDEIRYITQKLKLEQEVSQLLLQGRTMGVSVIGGTQRPYYIPLECYDQATHLFFWKDTDKRNLERLSDISGIDGPQIAGVVQSLGKHEVCYVNSALGTYTLIRPESYS